MPTLETPAPDTEDSMTVATVILIVALAAIAYAYWSSARETTDPATP